MPFQSVVRNALGFGVPGEEPFDGPSRIHPGVTGSTDAANNVFGRFFTQASAGGVMAAGGAITATVVAGGFMVNPKEHVAFTGLGATLAIPNGINSSFMMMGFVILQTNADQPAAPRIGDQVRYKLTTGEIITVPVGTAATTGYADVPTAFVHHLPGLSGAAQLVSAKISL